MTVPNHTFDITNAVYSRGDRTMELPKGAQEAIDKALADGKSHLFVLNSDGKGKIDIYIDGKRIWPPRKKSSKKRQGGK